MTEQEVFDISAAHLLAQNCQSKHAGPNLTTCYYRGPDGLQCAVGPLIPDALYTRDMELQPVGMLFDVFPEVAEHIGEDNIDLLEDLQNVHDNHDPLAWPEMLAGVADTHNLNMEVLA